MSTIQIGIAAGVALVVALAAVISYRREGWLYRAFNPECNIPSPDELFPEDMQADVDYQRLAHQLCRQTQRAISSPSGRSKLRSGNLIVSSSRRHAPDEVIQHVLEDIEGAGWDVSLREYPNRVQFVITRPTPIAATPTGLPVT